MQAIPIRRIPALQVILSINQVRNFVTTCLRPWLTMIRVPLEARTIFMSLLIIFHKNLYVSAPCH